MTDDTDERGRGQVWITFLKLRLLYLQGASRTATPSHEARATLGFEGAGFGA